MWGAPIGLSEDVPCEPFFHCNGYLLLLLMAPRRFFVTVVLRLLRAKEIP